MPRGSFERGAAAGTDRDSVPARGAWPALTSHIKWQFDYARTFFNWGAGVKGDIKDRPDESVFESQLQISF